MKHRTPLTHIFTVLAFLTNSLGPITTAQAYDFRLPAPGVMVHLSPPLDPPILKGMKVHLDNPFLFDFIMDKGESRLSNEQLKDESSKLIKYFLASLTIPEKDLWVNLSPYEKNRIIPQSFGLTEMGRDLLAEDYMLKQITASLIYPEDAVGEKFWKRIYAEAVKRFGTTDIPVNTFNKVWIVPEKAIVYENAKVGTAYIVESKLKVMLEEDYLSLQEHEGIGNGVQIQEKATNQLGNQIVREIIIPELTKEVNQDKNFFQLRQAYQSLILATWYKKKIKESILSRVYVGKNKILGVNINDPREKQEIYQRYLQAFKKGVYNYIKEETDPLTQQVVAKKYFSGGIEWKMDKAMIITSKIKKIVASGKEVVIKVYLRLFGSNDNYGSIERKGNIWVFKSPPVEQTQPKSLEERAKDIVNLFDENRDPQYIAQELFNLGFEIFDFDREHPSYEKAWQLFTTLEKKAISKGFVINRDALFHSFVLYQIVETYIDHTSEGDVKTYFVRQIHLYHHGRVLYGHYRGWSDVGNNYIAIDRDWVDRGDENEIQQALRHEEVVDVFPHSEDPLISARMERMKNLFGMLIRKGFSSAVDPMQRRSLVEQGLRLHEVEHEIRRRILERQGLNPLNSNNDLDELLAELKSIIDADEPNHIVAYLLMRATPPIGSRYAWRALSFLTDRPVEDEDGILHALEILVETSQDNNALRAGARKGYKEIERQWEDFHNKQKSGQSAMITNEHNPWVSYETSAEKLKKIQRPINYQEILGDAQILFMGENHANISIRNHLAQRAKELKSLGITHYAIEAPKNEKIDRLNEGENVDLSGVNLGPGGADYERVVKAFVAEGIKIVPIDIDQDGYKREHGQYPSQELREQKIQDNLTDIFRQNPKARVAVLIGDMHTYKKPMRSLKNLDEEDIYIGKRMVDAGYKTVTVGFVGGNQGPPLLITEGAQRAGLGKTDFMFEDRETSQNKSFTHGEKDFIIHLAQTDNKHTPMPIGYLPAVESISFGEAFRTSDQSEMPVIFMPSQPIIMSLPTEDEAKPDESDKAMRAKGGIDFNTANMNLQLQNNGGEIKFHLDPGMLQRLRNAPGFVPVIINIQPMRSLRSFLGLADNQSPIQTI